MTKQIFVLILSCFLFAHAAHASTSPELVNAATAGQTEELVALIDGGADVQSDGGTALISAAFSALQRHEESKPIDDQVEAVRILAEDGRTALSYAEEKEHAEITEVLRQTGAK